jgi:F-type H+-transporting ATPase subunit gamma
MKQREIKRVGFLIISTDRGLCGGLNINLFKRTVRSMKEWADQGIEIELSLIGAKAAAFFNSYGGNVTSAIRDIGEKPTLADLIGGVKTMLDAYEEGRIDRLFLVSNQFVNTMTQNPMVEQLLPLEAEDSQEMKHHWDYIYEPEARELLERLLTRYIESQVYQAVVENGACEQAARMLAMKNATENAGELIDDLQLIYNKARQAAITQELSEIVSGAAAIG